MKESHELPILRLVVHRVNLSTVTFIHLYQTSKTIYQKYIVLPYISTIGLLNLWKSAITYLSISLITYV